MKSSKIAFESTHDRLRSEGYEPEQSMQVRPKVSTSEKGKRYVLVTNGVEESVVYAVDGNIIKVDQRCDKLVLVKHQSAEANSEQWSEIFVELKGVDAIHAIDQLRETLKKSIFQHSSNIDIRARIVAQSFPSNKSNPIMEKAKKEFRIKYNCDLRGMKTGQEDRL